MFITGNGGGKWYNCHVAQLSTHTARGERAILMDGVSEPLHCHNSEAGRMAARIHVQGRAGQGRQ